jgi:hypothetical protein
MVASESELELPGLLPGDFSVLFVVLPLGWSKGGDRFEYRLFGPF